MAADPTFIWAMAGPPTPFLLSQPCAGCSSSPLGHLMDVSALSSSSLFSFFSSVALISPTRCSLIPLRAHACAHAGWRGGQQDLRQASA